MSRPAAASRRICSRALRRDWTQPPDARACAGSRPASRCPGAPALRDGRVHGIWSGLVTSPLLVPLLAECLGRWLQPGGCAPLDPAKTLADLNRFFAHPLQGPLWLSLGED